MNAFVYRGNRDYVLGADVLDAVLAQLYGKKPRPEHVDYQVRKPCHCESFRLAERKEAKDEENALALYQDKGHDLVILPAGAEVKKRVPCIETQLEPLYQFALQAEFPSVAVADLPKHISLCHALVPSFKCLLQRVFPPQPSMPTHYLFARLLLHRMDFCAFSIRFERMFATRYFEGKILVENSPVGFLYFSKENMPCSV